MEKETKKNKKYNSQIIIIIACVIIAIVVGLICFWALKSDKKNENKDQKVVESIHCTIGTEQHSLGIMYNKSTGEPIKFGGDDYFSKKIEIDKYKDAKEIFDAINDYVQKNDGTCSLVKDKDLNSLVKMTIKKDSLTKTGVTVLIESPEGYSMTTGEGFWLEKYDSKTQKYQKLPIIGSGCTFIDIGIVISKDSREISQDWSCMYEPLEKGKYRIVKDVYFNSMATFEENTYYVWADFEIE